MTSLPSGSRGFRGGRSLGDLLGIRDDPFRRAQQEVFGVERGVEVIPTSPTMSLRAFVEGAWHVLEPDRHFLPNWHVDAICEHLEWVAAGELQRLIINIPPGYAKSVIVAVLWPAWMWTWRPSWRSIFASYDERLSVRDSVRCRTVMTSPWYRETIRPGWRFTSDQNVKGYYRNSRMGERLAISTGGANTGFRGDNVTVDDPISAKDRNNVNVLEAAIDWWDRVMSSRLNDQRTGTRVIVMQRLHEKDLTGHALAKGGYEHLCLPSEFDPKRRSVTVTKSGHTWEDPRTEEGELLFPALFPEDVLDQAKIDLGSVQYAAQHGQLPVPATGGIFKREWFRRYRKADLPPVWNETIQSWDLTFKKKEDSDFVVGEVWSRLGANSYLRFERRGRMGFSESKRAVREVSRAFPEATAKLIEDKANGPAIMDELRDEIEGLIGVSDPGGVLAQAWAVQPIVEAGNVWIPDESEWPEVENWLDEICGFPKAANDDRVAAFTQAIIRLAKHRRGAGAPVPSRAPVSEAAAVAGQRF
jgi:predicted phage terminase large subunit-like protein